jgi:hypothetical protein
VIYRAVCCALSVICAIPVLQNTNTIADFMPSYIGAAIATVKDSCWEFYHLIGDKTKASLRRVLHRIFRLNLTTATVNGGMYDPLAARIARYYPNTTVQNRCFVTRLWLSKLARCTQCGFFEATAGECDELETTPFQHGMNGDCIDEDNCK